MRQAAIASMATNKDAAGVQHVLRCKGEKGDGEDEGEWWCGVVGVVCGARGWGGGVGKGSGYRLERSNES